jgi:guanidinoacetate N-methyltransferase
VVVTHGNLAASTFARHHYYPHPPECFLLLSSFAFDSSVAGLFWSLTTGATLVIPEEEAFQQLTGFADLIAEHRVDTLLSIPSIYRHLVQTGAAKLGTLRTAIVAGESCPPELIAEHNCVLPGAMLYNEYGPTEATVWASVYACSAYVKGARVPIGRPAAHAQIFILDDQQRLCPVGVVGEIVIGGAGVSPGYFNRKAETKERFVDPPAGLDITGKVYRSGDLGYWNDAGELEFLGRIDRQVKIRGQRIELEAIEQVIRAQSEVREAVVAVEKQLNSDPAFLVQWLKRIPEVEAREFLARVQKERASVQRGDVHFTLNLQLGDEGFIAPPRESQRTWLLEQAMDEFSDDLKHLNQVAKAFVPGTESRLRESYPDIAEAALTEQEVLEDWQHPLMQAMANIVTEQAGDILEVGFGRGVSAEMIQQGGVNTHTIIEPNAHSIETWYRPFAEKYSEREVHLLVGRWQEVLDQLKQYDAIFFHAFPLNEQEFVEHILKSITYAQHAMETLAQHIKPGGVFTYLTTEIDSLSRRHQRLLLKHFTSFSVQVVAVNVPEDTQDAWWAPSMVIVKAVK